MLEQTQKWFISTIPGILILGTLGSIIGSIVGKFIIKFLKWSWNKYLSDIIERFLYSYFRSYIVSKVICEKHISSKQLYPIIIILNTYLEFIIASLLMFSLLVTTILIFIFTHLQHNITLIVSISLCILSINWWLHRAMAMTGVIPDLFFDEKTKIEKQYKTSHDWYEHRGKHNILPKRPDSQYNISRRILNNLA